MQTPKKKRENLNKGGRKGGCHDRIDWTDGMDLKKERTQYNISLLQFVWCCAWINGCTCFHSVIINITRLNMCSRG